MIADSRQAVGGRMVEGSRQKAAASNMVSVVRQQAVCSRYGGKQQAGWRQVSVRRQKPEGSRITAGSMMLAGW